MDEVSPPTLLKSVNEKVLHTWACLIETMCFSRVRSEGAESPCGASVCSESGVAVPPPVCVVHDPFRRAFSTLRRGNERSKQNGGDVKAMRTRIHLVGIFRHCITQGLNENCWPCNANPSMHATTFFVTYSASAVHVFAVGPSFRVPFCVLGGV